MLKAAQALSHDKIQTFTSLKASLMSHIHRRSNGSTVVTEGSSTPTLPGLTEICKGFRRGEMVVLSGPTGAGKTTLLSQLSLDFATAVSSTGIYIRREKVHFTNIICREHQYYGDRLK